MGDDEWPSGVVSDSSQYIAHLISYQRSRRSAAVQAATMQTLQLSINIATESTSAPPPHIEPIPDLLIQATIVTFGDKTAEGQLVEGVAIPWLEIIRELERNPNFLQEVNWRTFEELIAGAYKREGWPEVVLTPRSGDKGRDVIATKPGVGALRIVDQVKAYKPGNRVPADDVRAVLGVLYRDSNVSKGVLTTTSTFAPGVEDEFKAFTPTRLELRTGETVVEWLKGLMPSR